MKKQRKDTNKVKTKSPLFRVLAMYAPIKWRIVVLLGIGVTGIIMFSFMPMFTRNVFNNLEESILQGVNPQLSFIYMQLVIFGLLVLFNEIFQVFAITLILKSEFKVKEKFVNDFKRKLDQVPISVLEQYAPGDLARRTFQTSGQVIRHSLSIVFRIARTSFFFITTAIVMFTISWILALVVILSLPIFIFTARLVSKKSQRFFNSSNTTVLENSGYVDQQISLHEFYKTHGIKGAEEEYEQYNQKEAKVMVGEEMAVAFNTIYVHLIQQFMFLLVTVVFGILFINRVLPEFGALPAFIVFSNRFLANAVIITEATNVLQFINARAPRIFEIMDQPDTLVENEHINVERLGDIQFSKVTLVRGETTILKNLNFTIPKGSSVAFVGHTGNGKGKIVEMLSKLEHPTEGQITVDGIDLQEVTRESYYRRMGIAFERPFIFKGTIAENLLYGVRRTLPEYVMEVTKRLGSHEFIEKLPNRYETEVTENSSLLTASQRQALNVARTVLKASDLIILSEALTTADPAMEKDIYEKIMSSNPKQTKIFVTHRLASIQNCDIIMYLEKGRITEMGTHDQLIKLGKKYYQAFVNE